MKLSPKIPDLHFKVVRINPMFARAGHATVFYRHDKDGAPFLYHFEAHYGEHGTVTRAKAFAYGRDVVRRKRQMGLRTLYVPVDHRPAVTAAGLNPDYAH